MRSVFEEIVIRQIAMVGAGRGSSGKGQRKQARVDVSQAQAGEFRNTTVASGLSYVAATNSFLNCRGHAKIEKKYVREITVKSRRKAITTR